MLDPLTLSEFILKSEKSFPGATGDLSQILGGITVAAKIINREINKVGLLDISGNAGNSNIHGEQQQKLDVYANEKFKQTLFARGLVAGMGSEEEDSFVAFDVENPAESKYVVLIDPIDGSSNIDTTVPVGTIFSIYKRVSKDTVCLEDFLQKGNQQVAAGYVIYGSSTLLVYTTGNGVNAFTFDPSVGDFYVSHEKLRFPEKSTMYSVNDSLERNYFPGMKDFTTYCRSEAAGLTSRYTGSLVADFHRNLLKGGIYCYPGTEGTPNGKLRLQYECNPLAFLAEQSGGMATDSINSIMDLQPTELHQRCPLFIGPKRLVKQAQDMHKTHIK